MRGLSKDQIKDRDHLLERVAESQSAAEIAVDEFNAVIEAAPLPHEKIEELNEAIRRLNEWMDLLGDEITDYCDEQSEQWQDGERGEQMRGWAECLEEVEEVDECVEPESCYLPDVSVPYIPTSPGEV